MKDKLANVLFGFSKELMVVACKIKGLHYEIHDMQLDNYILLIIPSWKFCGGKK